MLLSNYFVLTCLSIGYLIICIVASKWESPKVHLNLERHQLPILATKLV